MTKAEREALKAEFITGDYRTIKEFAEAKGIEYNSTFRKMASLERWTKDKNEHLEQIYKKTVKKHEQKRVEDALRDITTRQNKTLDVISKIRDKAEKIITSGSVSAKEINALASAMFRVNEIEKGILFDREGNADTKGLQPIINIMDCSKGGEDDE